MEPSCTPAQHQPGSLPLVWALPYLWEGRVEHVSLAVLCPLHLLQRVSSDQLKGLLKLALIFFLGSFFGHMLGWWLRGVI